MSDGRDLAKETATLCVACLSLVWVPPVAAAIVPLVALAALGRDLWGKCPQRATAAAIESVFAGMGLAHLPPARITAAREALAALPATARLDPATLVAAAKSDEGFDTAVLAAILAHLPASTAFETRSLIETALATGLRTCRAHPEFRATLTEALVLDTARGVGLLQQGLARIETTVTDTQTDVQRLLFSLEGLQRPEMNTLALRFGHPGPDGAGLTGLKAFLHDKAQDLQRLGLEIAALRGLSPRIDNIRGAAEDAVAGLRLDEARALLTEARDIQRDLLREPLLANAALIERLADIDLLQGKVHDAFTHLSAAADSFAGIDPLEPARRRLDYAASLYEHGLRYGGPGLGLAARMSRDALNRIDRGAKPDLWAETQNNLGAALVNQGIRIGGAEGAALLAEAVAAYRAAQQVYTRDAHPVHWAMTHLNMAIAELSLADHDSCADPLPPLRAALAHVDSALTVYDPVHMPDDHGTATALRDHLVTRLRDLGEGA